MSLFAIQQDFSAWLRESDPHAAARIGPDAGPGLDIYQNNYRSQLIACLDESFPHTRAWLGDTAFHAAVAAHIDSMPPSSWTLDAYARDVPASLAARYPDDAEVGELAWLELALSETFVGPDAMSMTVAEAAQVDWDTAVLRFVPTLAQRTVITNASAIWSALDEGQVPPGAETLHRPAAVIVWRTGLVSRFRTTDLPERDAMVRARDVRFAGFCEQLITEMGDSDGLKHAGSLLGRWLQDGLVESSTAAPR